MDPYKNHQPEPPFSDQPAPNSAEETDLKPVIEISPHQLFLQNLAQAGLTSGEIESRWQEYYQQLSPQGKQEVWASVQERQIQERQVDPNSDFQEITPKNKIWPAFLVGWRQLRNRQLAWSRPTRLGGDGREKLKYNLKTLFWAGLTGFLVYGFFQIAFFNENYLQPYIRPKAVVADAAVIITPDKTSVSPEAKLYIPKLGLELKVDYSVDSKKEGESWDQVENRFQVALKEAILHYPNSSNPGSSGNVVLFGHSGGNFFTSGNPDYKFAFSRLRDLADNDLIIANFEGQQFVYKVYGAEVVWPHETRVLGAAPQPNSITLITCDPPGRNTKRLVVYAQQISPSPDLNQVGPATTPVGQKVPGNSPSLLDSLRSSDY